MGAVGNVAHECIFLCIRIGELDACSRARDDATSRGARSPDLLLADRRGFVEFVDHIILRIHLIIRIMHPAYSVDSISAVGLIIIG